MSIPGSSSAVYAGRHHCRLLLPRSDRNGAGGHWGVHLGKQCVHSYHVMLSVIDDINSIPVRRIHHLRHPLGLPGIQPRPHESDHISVQR